MRPTERGKGRMFFGLNVFSFQARNEVLCRALSALFCLFFLFKCIPGDQGHSGKKALTLGRRQEAWHLTTVSSVTVTRAFLLE